MIYFELYSINYFLTLLYIKWIFLQSYFGLVHCFFSVYHIIYYVVQKKQIYFIYRLPPEVVCLQRVRLVVNF
jgi:hypothetical protein